MPLYAFVCERGHEVLAVRGLGNKKPIRCPTCGGLASYDFGATARGSIKQTGRFFSSGERESFFMQTGRELRTGRELNDWAEKNNKEIVDVRNGRPSEKAQEKKRIERRETLKVRARKIWQKEMLS